MSTITIYSDPNTLERTAALAVGLAPSGPISLDGSLALGAAALGQPSPEEGATPAVIVTTDPTVPADLAVLPNSYLALRRYLNHECLFGSNAPRTPFLLVIEPRRALNRRDVEGALQYPALDDDGGDLSDPAIARALDAGLLGIRTTRSLSRVADKARSLIANKEQA